MKIILIILILLPCFLKAQTDTTYSDTTKRISITKAGAVNFDTIFVSTNTLQCFHYVCSGFSKTQKLFGTVDVWVWNVDGVYNFSLDAATPKISSVGNSLTVNKVNNLIILQYISQVTTIPFTWTIIKNKISL